MGRADQLLSECKGRASLFGELIAVLSNGFRHLSIRIDRMGTFYRVARIGHIALNGEPSACALWVVGVCHDVINRSCGLMNAVA